VSKRIVQDKSVTQIKIHEAVTVECDIHQAVHCTFYNKENMYFIGFFACSVYDTTTDSAATW